VLKEDHTLPRQLHPGRRHSAHLDGSEGSYCPLYVLPETDAAFRGVRLPLELLAPRLFCDEDHALLTRVAFAVYNMHQHMGNVALDVEPCVTQTGQRYYRLAFNGVDEVRYSFLEVRAIPLPPRSL